MTTTGRRSVLTGLAAAGLAAPVVRAQGAGGAAPIRLGFLTVKTGPLASGGIQMEQGLLLYLKEHGNKLGDRPVELVTADTGGVPAQARTKTQELVERNRVHCIVGPLAAFELLAIDDYVRGVGVPTLSMAAADDVTQRKPNPWCVRPTCSSSQCTQPFGEYAATELGLKRVALISDDIAYGHEQLAGFQRTFEDKGGRVVQKLWPPLAVPDYGTYISQIKGDVDAVFMGFAGSNGFRFMRQFNEYGLGGRIKLMGGMTAVDESLLQNMGPDAVGMLSANWYSAELDNAVNRAFVEGMRRDYKVDPGYYAAGTHVAGSVLEHALRAVGGRVEDKDGLMAALRGAKVAETARGPVRFDEFGNVVGNVYVRRVERKGGKLVNAVIKTFPDVSQFWTYDQAAYLREPVYSRTSPPARNLEN